MSRNEKIEAQPNKVWVSETERTPAFDIVRVGKNFPFQPTHITNEAVSFIKNLTGVTFGQGLPRPSILYIGMDAPVPRRPNTLGYTLRVSRNIAQDGLAICIQATNPIIVPRIVVHEMMHAAEIAILKTHCLPHNTSEQLAIWAEMIFGRNYNFRPGTVGEVVVKEGPDRFRNLLRLVFENFRSENLLEKNPILGPSFSGAPDTVLRLALKILNNGPKQYEDPSRALVDPTIPSHLKLVAYLLAVNQKYSDPKHLPQPRRENLKENEVFIKCLQVAYGVKIK